MASAPLNPPRHQERRRREPDEQGQHESKQRDQYDGPPWPIGNWPISDRGHHRDVASAPLNPPRHHERRRREPDEQGQPSNNVDNRPSKRGSNHITRQEQPTTHSTAPQAERRAQTIDLTDVTTPRLWNRRRAEFQQVIREQLTRLYMLPRLEGGFHTDELQRFRINSLEAELIWWQNQHPM